MRRVPSEASAVDRASWLAELAEALVEAQKLAWQLGTMSGNPEAMELYGRIEGAIADIQALRLGRRTISSEEYDPNWAELLPWSTGPSEPAP